MDLKFSTKQPEIYKKLKEKFSINWDNGIIIADDETIYCKYQIPPEKVVHELEHIKQQKKTGVNLWWELYLNKDSFRLEQEVEAYRAEYNFIKDNIKDKNARFEYLYELSRALSSSQYGNMVTFDEAQKLINVKC